MTQETALRTDLWEQEGDAEIAATAVRSWETPQPCEPLLFRVQNCHVMPLINIRISGKMPNQ